MALSIHQQMLIEKKVTNQAKSVGVAYLLLVFLGGLGAHRFYRGRTGSGAVMLLLFLLGWLTLAIGVGLLLLALVGFWALLDLLLVPGMADKQKDRVRRDVEHQMLVAGSEGAGGAHDAAPILPAEPAPRALSATD